MTARARRIDLVADEFLAAVAGEMSPAELGVYWMINLLCYSRNGPVDFDLDWLRAKFRPGKANQVVGPIIDKLIASGRVVRDGDQIGVRRALDEVEKALRRISDASERGARGGRPRKEINGIEKGSALSEKKLTTNHQPSTTTSPNGEDARKRAIDEFDEWWQRYPHKVAKPAAQRAWVTARRKAPQEVLHAGLGRYMATKPADRPWCNPATWLNQERWNDQPAPVAAGPPVDFVGEQAAEWRRRLKGYRDLQVWVPREWGPAPVDPRCNAPPAVLAEFGFAKQPENV